MKRTSLARFVVIALLALAGLSACDNMQHQENVHAFAPSRRFANDSSARLPPAHTVSRTDPRPDDPGATGRFGGRWLAGIPMILDRDFVVRGADRFGIFCADCHGSDGGGRGIVVERGFPRPVSFYDVRVRSEPAGALFEAISHGSGVMYGFADRIGQSDRWAIVAYIRALEKSRNATLAEVPQEERARLTEQ